MTNNCLTSLQLNYDLLSPEFYDYQNFGLPILNVGKIFLISKDTENLKKQVKQLAP